MNNPFAFSHYVTGEGFCNRKKEVSQMINYIESSQNVLLYSHRRQGKSSLIQQVFEIVGKKKPGIGKIHIDLYGTVSEQDFIKKVFKGLSQLESNMDKLFKTISSAVKTFRFTIAVDPATNQPSFSPSFEALKEETMLEELMILLDRYSQKRKLVIAFDEFQEVATYTEEGFEKRLRSFIQRHTDICYIFAGSQQHLLTGMFNTSDQAFYKLADSFPLEKIEDKAYISWIQKLVNKKGIKLPRKIVQDIVTRFENHPMYIQNFMFHLWNLLPDQEISTETIDTIEASILDRKHLEYSALWEGLTINQKKTLKLVLINDGRQLFNADALKSVGLRTGSLVTKALSALIKKEILVKNGRYCIQDILLKKWLSRTLEL